MAFTTQKFATDVSAINGFYGEFSVVEARHNLSALINALKNQVPTIGKTTKRHNGENSDRG